MANEDLELAVLRLGWSLDALDKWRATTDDRLHDVEEAMRKMVTAQEIADAVAAKLSARKRLELTFTQKAVALVVSGLAIAAELHGLGAF